MHPALWDGAEPQRWGRDDPECSRLQQLRASVVRHRALRGRVGGPADRQAFLAECGVRVRMSALLCVMDPRIDRVFELVNRANRLNFTKRRRSWHWELLEKDTDLLSTTPSPGAATPAPSLPAMPVLPSSCGAEECGGETGSGCGRSIRPQADPGADPEADPGADPGADPEADPETDGAVGGRRLGSRSARSSEAWLVHCSDRYCDYGLCGIAFVRTCEIQPRGSAHANPHTPSAHAIRTMLYCPCCSAHAVVPML